MSEDPQPCRNQPVELEGFTVLLEDAQVLSLRKRLAGSEHTRLELKSSLAKSEDKLTAAEDLIATLTKKLEASERREHELEAKLACNHDELEAQV